MRRLAPTYPRRPLRPLAVALIAAAVLAAGFAAPYLVVLADLLGRW